MLKNENNVVKISSGDKSIGTAFTINYWPFSFARTKLSKKDFKQLESTIHKKIEDHLEKHNTKNDLFYLKNKAIIENIVNKIIDSEISKSFN